MTAKELLDRIVQIPKAIAYRKTKIEALELQAENTTQRLTGMPHNQSAEKSTVAAAICRMVDLEREIVELEEERKTLIAMIDLLENDDLSRLLTLRYVQGERWEDIAAEMHYCDRQIFRLHSQAKKELDNKLANVSQCQ